MLKLFRRIRYLLQQSRVDRDLAQEVEFHRAMEAERLEREGLDRATAHSVSVRLMGNVTLAREDARQVWIGRACDRLWHDTRYAFRSLRRNVFFAAVAVLTLALGIAANTAMFSVIDAILPSLPYADPIGWCCLDCGSGTSITRSHFVSTLSDWRGATGVADLAFWRERAGNITSGGEPERVVGPCVGESFSLSAFHRWSAYVHVDEAGRQAVVVLSHRLGSAAMAGNKRGWTDSRSRCRRFNHRRDAGRIPFPHEGRSALNLRR